VRLKGLEKSLLMGYQPATFRHVIDVDNENRSNKVRGYDDLGHCSGVKCGRHRVQGGELGNT
jgi:hypothetical protein